MLLSVLISFCAIAIVVAGFLAWLRNTEKSENKWFLIFTVFLSIWSVCNFLDSSDVVPANVALYLVKVDFAIAPLIGWAFVQFATSIVQNPHLRSGKLIRSASGHAFRLYSLGAALVVSLLALFGFVFTATVQDNTLHIATLPLLGLYSLVVILTLGSALVMLIHDYLASSKSDRRRLSLVLLGFLVAALGNIATNLVFPVFIDDRHLVKDLNTIGYLSIFGMALCIYVAITTRKLFDIRLTIVRSLVYVLLFACSAAIYVGLVVTISYGLLDRNTIPVGTLVTGLIATLFVSVTFKPLKRAFDAVTRRIFFRDTYDTQDTLDKLSDLTTATIKVDILLTKTAELFSQTLKTNACVFVLESNGVLNRAIGNDKSKTPSIQLMHLLQPALMSQPIVVEMMPPGSTLAHALRKDGFEVVIPLYINDSLLGCMALGMKRNGTAYVQQDLRLLTLAAATLTVAIQNALRFEEIERFNATLQQRVEEATRKLRRTNEKLRQLDETKDDFISMASHQLRTPLTSVKGYVSMVVEGDAGELNPMQKKLLNQAFISAQRMVYLISDLLNVSRLRTGKFIIEPVQSNLSNIIQEEVRQLIPTAKGRGLELIYHRPEHFPILMFDETKMRQVVMNFIDNAIYYTPTGGTITVNIADKPETIEFTVTDTGIGVPKSDQHHLFSKFYRANNAKRARPDGTGLGLFMAKKVIVAQGGATIFKSQEGKGSTFGFTFAKEPLMPTRPPESHVLKH